MRSHAGSLHSIFLASLFFFLASVPVRPATAAQVPQTAVVRLSEVLYDTPGLDGEREWVEIANLGESAVRLEGYGLGDEEQQGGQEGMLRFPQGTVLLPGHALVVAQTARGFRALYGRAPDLEIVDSESAVPDMIADISWSNGRFALANKGDDLLLLDAANQPLDALSYGEAETFMQPSIPGVVSGLSLARTPSMCDSDRAGDWKARRAPSPGDLELEGECAAARTTAVEDRLTIGAIQGRADVSPLLHEFVIFDGLVTGIMEDRNAAGIVYYTLFVQDPPGLDDRDPATSDGIAVFVGRQRPAFLTGQHVRIRGQVTEFYGLTEIDDRGLTISVTGEPDSTLLPQTLMLPEEEAVRAAYLEAREGMLVGAPSPAMVFGPTHSGCGFAVAAWTGQTRPLVHAAQDFPPAVVLVQNSSDVDCQDLPQVKAGDQVSSIEGPLTYHFDQYKIVLQNRDRLQVEYVELPTAPTPPTVAPEQSLVATLNLEDFLTAPPEGEENGERPSSAQLGAKKEKLVQLIGRTLACPTLLAVQEVETFTLLQELSTLLGAACGFSYQISHRDSPDGRGIDVALLSDPRRATVTAVALRQSCTSLETEVVDSSVVCLPGESPLFSRPPLEVALLLDNKPLTIWVTHFKSKRGGADETAARRLAQARYVRELAAAAIAADPRARLLVLGDINDYDQSPAWLELSRGGMLVDVLQSLPEEERYSYVFDGMGQLIDGIFVSAPLLPDVAMVAIAHTNADYPAGQAGDLSPAGLPFRSSDHDAPLLVLGRLPEPTATVVPTGSLAPAPATLPAAPTLTTQVVQVTIPAAAAHTAVPARREEPPAAETDDSRNIGYGRWFVPLLATILFTGGLLAARRWTAPD